MWMARGGNGLPIVKPIQATAATTATPISTAASRGPLLGRVSGRTVMAPRDSVESGARQVREEYSPERLLHTVRIDALPHSQHPHQPQRQRWYVGDDEECHQVNEQERHRGAV